MSLSPITLARPRGFTAAIALPVVRELHVDAEIRALEQPDHALQVVPVLAADPQLVPLDRSLDLELAALDHLHDLARLVRRDPLLERDLLARRAAERLLDLAEGERLERHVALHQASLEHVAHGLELELVRGRERQLLSRELDVRARPLEVEARLDLLHRLRDRVLDLLEVHAADDVERAVGHWRDGLSGNLGNVGPATGPTVPVKCRIHGILSNGAGLQDRRAERLVSARGLLGKCSWRRSTSARSSGPRWPRRSRRPGLSRPTGKGGGAWASGALPSATCSGSPGDGTTTPTLSSRCRSAFSS